MDSGVFPRGDAKLVTFAIMGAINWIPLWFKPTGSAKADDVATVFADYLVGGLLAPQARLGRSDGAPPLPLIGLPGSVRAVVRRASKPE
jgi:hypothetical protein